MWSRREICSPGWRTRLAGSAARLGIAGLLQGELRQGNRSALAAARGPGWSADSSCWRRARGRRGLPLLTDVHEPAQARDRRPRSRTRCRCPAFLCRQTDLLLACGRTGKPVNVKKGQWMGPEAMAGALEKVREGGSRECCGHRAGHLLRLRRPGGGLPESRPAARSDRRPGDLRRDPQRAAAGQGPGGSSGGAAGAHPGAARRRPRRPGRTDSFSRPIPIRRGRPATPTTQWPLDRLEAAAGADPSHLAGRAGAGVITPEEARRVRLLALDVDGVLTDNGIWIAPSGPAGRSSKRFDIQDGLGLRCCGTRASRWPGSAAGIPRPPRCGPRSSASPTLIQDNEGRKLPAMERLLAKGDWDGTSWPYVGDDLADLPILRRAGSADHGRQRLSRG